MEDNTEREPFIQYAENLYCVDLEVFGPKRVCAYVFVDKEEVAIIDCGPEPALAKIDAFLHGIGKSLKQVSLLLLSHIHLDHAGGAGTLAGISPSVRIGVHPAGIKHLIDPSKLAAGSAEVYGPERMKGMGKVESVPQPNMFEYTDGMEIKFGPLRFTALETHGHAYHHYSFMDRGNRRLFAGDACGVSYDNQDGIFKILPTAPTQFDPTSWRETTAKLKKENPAEIYITHFGRWKPEDLYPLMDEYLDACEAICAEAAKGENIPETVLNELVVLCNRKMRMNETPDGKYFHDFNISSQGMIYLAQKLKKNKENDLPRE